MGVREKQMSLTPDNFTINPTLMTHNTTPSYKKVDQRSPGFPTVANFPIKRDRYQSLMFLVATHGDVALILIVNTI